MAQEFVSDSTGSVRPNSEPEKPKRQPIRYIIVSSPEQVRQEILKFTKWDWLMSMSGVPCNRHSEKAKSWQSSPATPNPPAIHPPENPEGKFVVRTLVRFNDL
jgi:hypothetical protein